MSIKQKLIAGFSILTLLLLTLQVMNLRSLATLNNEIDTLRDRGLPMLMGLTQTKSGFLGVRARTATLSVDDRNDEVRQRQYEQTAESFKELHEGVKLIDSLALTAEDKPQWEEFKSQVGTFEALATRLVAEHRVFDEARKADNQQEIDAARARTLATFNECSTAFSPARKSLYALFERHGDVALADAADVDEAGGLTQRQSQIGAVAGLVVSIVLTLLILRAILRPLNSMLTVIRDMTEGSRDLSQRVDGERRDELGLLGRAFNAFVDDLNRTNARNKEQSDKIAADAQVLQGKVEQMLVVAQAAGRGDLTARVSIEGDDAMGKLADGFREMIASISSLIRETASGTEQIDAGAQQIAGASQSLASGSSQQAASLEEIAASLEEITSMTNQNADNAQQAAVLSADAQKSAAKGKNETTELSGAMKQIQESSEKIGVIIKTIDDIAFQTNLLALNAAVEAARAGEAGKGFAVVAEEVRNLAQRSAEAAKNTASMINESKDRANVGVHIAGRVSSVLDEILSGSTKVNSILAEIASASKEQATGIVQVNKGVAELDKVTQQTAGNSEELASASEETASQVATLRDLVKRFKVDSSAPLPRPTPPAAISTNRPTRAPSPRAASNSRDDAEALAAF